MLAPRFRDYYDWIVLGDHPGALLSASLAAKLGLSALVLPLDPGMGLKISDNGQCFDPESNFLMGLRNLVHSRGLLGECLSRVGMTSLEEHLVSKESALPQVLTPEERLVFTLRDDEFAVESERELGKEATARFGLPEALREAEAELLKHWVKLPDRLTWSSSKNGDRAVFPKGSPAEIRQPLSFLRKNAALSADQKKNWLTPGMTSSRYRVTPGGYGEFEELCAGLWYGVTGAPDSDVRLHDLLHVLAIARTGASFRGGRQAYRDFLLRLARRTGVHISSGECRRIFVEKGRLVGVQVAQHGSMISVGGGVLGCRISSAAERISSDGKAGSKELKKAAKPVGWKFSIALSVHAEAIPPGLSRRAVWQERGAPPLEIELADPADYGLQDRDTVIVHLRTVLAFADETLHPNYQVLMATRMLRQVSAIIPFFEYHVTRIYPDFRKGHPGLDSRIGHSDPDSPEFQSAMAELREAYPFTALSEIPGNLRSYSGKGTGPRSGVEGLFVASDEAYPQLGSFGSTVAALEGLAWLAHRGGLAGPLV